MTLVDQVRIADLDIIGIVKVRRSTMETVVEDPPEIVSMDDPKNIAILGSERGNDGHYVSLHPSPRRGCLAALSG